MEKLTLTAEDRALAIEYRDHPTAPHGARLQRILNVFRGGPLRGKYVLFATQPHREWLLGRLTGERAAPIEVFEGCRFASTAEAEWEVFKLRWAAHGGPPLVGESVVEPGAASPAPVALRITAYADQLSVRPGETLRFMVNDETGAGFDAGIVRLICGDLNPAGPGFKEEAVETAISGRYAGRRQAIHAGSCVVIEDAPALRGLTSVSLSARVWPTLPGAGAQTVIAKFSANESSGFALMLDESGAAALRVGDGTTVATISTEVALKPREWAWVGASFDGASGRGAVFQEDLRRYPVGASDGAAERELGVGLGETAAPLSIAAHVAGEAADMGGHYDGKIEAPRVAGAALDAEALKRLQREPSVESALVAAWDFGREIPTTRVFDTGPNALHGRTVNLPARAMKGSNWSAAEHCWRHAPDEYGAIHFHRDDLYDTGWDADFALQVPSLGSGLYAAKLSGGGTEEYVPFYVRPPRGGPTAKVLFLAPTASYMAYGNYLLALEDVGCEQGNARLLAFEPNDAYLAAHPEYGRSLYDLHADGSGIVHFSRLQPNLTMRPKFMRWDGGGGSAIRQFNADTHLIDWLEAMGHAYDVATDEDLHAEGLACLEPYACVVTGSHPEYYTTRMWETVRAYTEAGGRLMYMGGNGFFWHIAHHESLPGVIEVRKADVSRNWENEPGERHLAFSGEFSGGLRTGGRPPQELLGVGMEAMGFDRGAPYVRGPDSFDPRAAFIFEGVGAEESIGEFGLMTGGAAGIEIDRAEPALGTPPHALVVASSAGLHSDMFRAVIEDLMGNDVASAGAHCETVRADMVFFETAAGGGVFSTGSIAWCGALSHNGYDNNVSRVTDNVLRRFAADTPLI